MTSYQTFVAEVSRKCSSGGGLPQGVYLDDKRTILLIKKSKRICFDIPPKYNRVVLVSLVYENNKIRKFKFYWCRKIPKVDLRAIFVFYRMKWFIRIITMKKVMTVILSSSNLLTF